MVVCSLLRFFLFCLLMIVFVFLLFWFLVFRLVVFLGACFFRVFGCFLLFRCLDVLIVLLIKI